MDNLRFAGRAPASGDSFISFCASMWFLSSVIPVTSQAQIAQQAKPQGSEPIPQPAIPAILSAFDQYEVVGITAAHGMKEVDDFILSLVRTPALLEKINDIAVECGNSLYQPVFDRYIAGEQVPFGKSAGWRNTTMTMRGTSGFYEQLLPLVRAVNQKLPPGKRIRVLAGDPAIDWDQVKTTEDFFKFMNRDTSAAAVMEREVLSKHRKALMLYGTFHLAHGSEGGAVINL